MLRWCADLSGRRARWKQLCMRPRALTLAILFDVIELRRLGYPTGIIRQMWDRKAGGGLDREIVGILLDLEFDISSDYKHIVRDATSMVQAKLSARMGNADAPIAAGNDSSCLLYTSPSPRDQRGSRMPSSA